MFDKSSRGTCIASQALEGGPREMLLLIIALVVILALFGAGFALHVLWWLAIAALVIFLVSFFLRR